MHTESTNDCPRSKADNDVVIVRRAGLDVGRWRLYDEYAVTYPGQETRGEAYRSLEDATARGRELAQARRVALWYDRDTDDLRFLASFKDTSL